jgi:hypothetical protein
MSLRQLRARAKRLEGHVRKSARSLSVHWSWKDGTSWQVADETGVVWRAR